MCAVSMPGFSKGSFPLDCPFFLFLENKRHIYSTKLQIRVISYVESGKMKLYLPFWGYCQAVLSSNPLFSKYSINSIWTELGKNVNITIKIRICLLLLLMLDGLMNIVYMIFHSNFIDQIKKSSLLKNITIIIFLVVMFLF